MIKQRIKTDLKWMNVIANTIVHCCWWNVNVFLLLTDNKKWQTILKGKNFIWILALFNALAIKCRAFPFTLIIIDLLLLVIASYCCSLKQIELFYIHTMVTSQLFVSCHFHFACSFFLLQTHLKCKQTNKAKYIPVQTNCNIMNK